MATGPLRHAFIGVRFAAPLRVHPVRRFARHPIHYLDLPTHVEVFRLRDAARGSDPPMQDTDD
ncbi:hypothetical protein [Coralloluteibacterium thermophilus]|uniref:Uncharacterized protein n=1 Tax=Coralloluteibacterium thermophilum TaxID=2707049 RepID=A0ABV9NPL2_9GAMM